MYSFTSVARLPAPGDNVAIATQEISAGTRIQFEKDRFTLSHSVLEGHRFAIESIGEGEPLYYHGVCLLVMLHVLLSLVNT